MSDKVKDVSSKKLGLWSRFELNPVEVRAVPETVVHFQIRMPPATHERLASRAREEKSSLNALIVAILTEAFERHEGSAGDEGADESVDRSRAGSARLASR
jgi:hypothetical protein